MCIHEGNKDGFNIDREGPGVTVLSDSSRATRPGNVYIVCMLTCYHMIFARTTNLLVYTRWVVLILTIERREEYVTRARLVPSFGYDTDVGPRVGLLI